MLSLWHFIIIMAIVCLLAWFLSEKEERTYVGLRPFFERLEAEKKAQEVSAEAKAAALQEERDKVEAEQALIELNQLSESQVVNRPWSDLLLDGRSAPEGIYVHEVRESRILTMLGGFKAIKKQYKDFELAHRGRKMSVGEFTCRLTLETIFGRPFPTKHPEWLRSSKTGNKLELDGFCEELLLAFEYNGEQHYVYPHPFHQNYYAFLTYIRHDQYKRAVCALVGVTLLIISHEIKPRDIPEYIAYLLPPELDSFRLDLSPAPV